MQREGKQLNSLKKFEIGLRSFTTRLEIVRRDLPSNFDPYLKTCLKTSMMLAKRRWRHSFPILSSQIHSNESFKISSSSSCPCSSLFTQVSTPCTVVDAII